MTTNSLLDTIITACGGGIITGLVFVFGGGYKQQKQKTENTLVDAIEKAGNYLAKSNENLQEDIRKLSKEYEIKINQLEKKFELREKEYILRIENLELENKNLRLENANLILENDRLTNIRRIG